MFNTTHGGLIFPEEKAHRRQCGGEQGRHWKREEKTSIKILRPETPYEIAGARESK